MNTPLQAMTAALCYLLISATLVSAHNLIPGDSLCIVILGSSTAEGIGASTFDSSWVGRYTETMREKNPACRIINFAHRGYTSFHLQPNGYRPSGNRPLPDTLRNITKALSLSPTAIILSLPSNDAASNISVQEQIENFERIVAEAAAAGIQIWVSTTQPRNLTASQRQNLITMRDWIQGRYLDYSLDFWSGIASDDGTIVSWADYKDGIHLNNTGHAILAQRVNEARMFERFLLSDSLSIRRRDNNSQVIVSSGIEATHVSITIQFHSSGTVTFILYNANGTRILDVYRGVVYDDNLTMNISTTPITPGMYPWVLLHNGSTCGGKIDLRG